MSGKNLKKVAKIFQRRPRAYDIAIRKKDDEGWRVGTLPFENREDMIAHLRDNPAGAGQVYDLSDKDLSGADLSGADLSGAIMLKTNLAGANLAGANLSGILIEDGDMTNTRLIRVDIGHSIIRNTSLEGATLRDVDAQGAELDQIGRLAADLEKTFRGFYNLNGRRISPPGLTGRLGPRPGY